MSDFVQLVQANGPLGLLVGLLVLVAVFLLAQGGVVVTKTQKQSANVILSILLAGLQLLNPQSQDVIVALIASVGSALVYEFLRWAGKKYSNTAKAKAKPDVRIR